jgi:hypothetical protein
MALREQVLAPTGLLRMGLLVIGVLLMRHAPAGEDGVVDAAKTITLAEKLDVAPRSTVVLHLPENAGAK